MSTHPSARRTMIHGQARIRPAAVAGSFYPAQPGALRRRIEQLLPGGAPRWERVTAVMVPHAGYDYSGGCAAAVFGQVTIPESVIILGPSHYPASGRHAGAFVWPSGAFSTPLGDLPVEEQLVSLLMARFPLTADPMIHELDHAIEVELPFLQVCSPSRIPSIVPILLALEDAPSCGNLGAALAAVVRARPPGSVLMLASSDMTHFEPAEDALRHDQPALDAIRRMDGEGLLRACESHRITMCGRAAMAAVLEASRLLGASRAEVVAHTHSGLASGDFASVVSYAGVIIR